MSRKYETDEDVLKLVAAFEKCFGYGPGGLRSGGAPSEEQMIHGNYKLGVSGQRE